MAVSPDVTLVVGGCFGNVVRIWDANAGCPVDVLEGHTSIVLSVAFTSDGNSLMSGSRDRIAKYWDVIELLVCHRIHNSHFRTLSLAR